MASRPIEAKQRRRAAKALRRQSPPAFIDLVQWLKDRRYARTTGEANRIILAKRVMADSHPLGIKRVPTLLPNQTIKEQDVVSPLIPAAHRGRIVVLPAKT